MVDAHILQHGQVPGGYCAASCVGTVYSTMERRVSDGQTKRRSAKLAHFNWIFRGCPFFDILNDLNKWTTKGSSCSYTVNIIAEDSNVAVSFEGRPE